MNILIVVLNAGLAGHTRTSAAIGKALQVNCHNITVLIGKDSTSSIFDEKGLACERTTHAQGWLGYYPQLRQDFARLTEKHKIDLVHCFDGLAITQVASVCKYLNLRCFFTLCGGPPQKFMLSVCPTICLSQEGKDRLIQITKLKNNDIKVIPARIDLSEAIAPVDHQLLYDFRTKYALPHDARVVLRIARIGLAYITGIFQAIDAVADLYTKGYPVRFVHIGYVQDQYLYRVLKEKIEAVNARCGTNVVITAQDEASYASRYIGLADIVIGVGRSAFEAMSLKKPVIVIGKDWFAGAVSADTVNILAYYNFSGRNAMRMTFDASVLALRDALRRLMDDVHYYASLSAFGLQYVEEYLDSQKAAKEYEQVYSSYSGKDYPGSVEIWLHTVFPIELWKTLLLKCPLIWHMVKLIRQRISK